MEKRTSLQSIESIAPFKCMNDYYREEDATPNEPIANEFNARIKELQEEGMKRGMFIGEALIFLNRNLGITWRTVRYCDFPAALSSIQNGGQLFPNLVNPLMAAAMAEGKEKHDNMSIKEICKEIIKKFTTGL